MFLTCWCLVLTEQRVRTVETEEWNAWPDATTRGDHELCLRSAQGRVDGQHVDQGQR